MTKKQVLETKMKELVEKAKNGQVEKSAIAKKTDFSDKKNIVNPERLAAVVKYFPARNDFNKIECEKVDNLAVLRKEYADILKTMENEEIQDIPENRERLNAVMFDMTEKGVTVSEDTLPEKWVNLYKLIQLEPKIVEKSDELKEYRKARPAIFENSMTVYGYYIGLITLRNDVDNELYLENYSNGVRIFNHALKTYVQEETGYTVESDVIRMINNAIGVKSNTDYRYIKNGGTTAQNAKTVFNAIEACILDGIIKPLERQGLTSDKMLTKLIADYIPKKLGLELPQLKGVEYDGESLSENVKIA